MAEEKKESKKEPYSVMREREAKDREKKKAK